MAKPTAPTEFGGSKVHPLVDATAVTPAAFSWLAVQSSTSGEATYPVAWAGVATHREDDTVTAPGGFTGLATAKAPVVMVAGKDGTTAKAMILATGAPAGTEEGLITRNIPSGTQTVSGTVTATIAASVTEDAASAGGETSLLIAGVRNDAAASKTSTDGDFGNLALDAAGRVGIADLGGSISVDDGAGSLTVDGTVTTNAGTGFASLAVVGGGVEASALRVTIANDSTGVLSVDDNGTTLSIDDGGGSLTIDGTVTANQGTAAAGSGAWPIAVTNTADTVVKPGDAVNNAVRVNVVAGSSASTEYTEGDVDSTITGVAILWEDTSDILRTVSAAKPLPVSDAGGSLTVDNATLSITGGGVETAALRVTLANDSTGVLSVDDNGGSLTVDGSVSITGAVDTELTTADLDTGAGTDTRAVVGMVLAASGGGLLVGAANPMPISDNGGSITVDGTVAVTQSTSPWVIGDGGSTISIDDGAGSLTVDGTVSITGTVTVDTELPAAAALTDDFANPTAPAVGAFNMLWDGAAWDRAPGSSADGALVNLGANNDVTVTGTVTANAGTGLASLAVVGGGVEATALRVTIASDSTGVLSVDDNGSSLTVDGTVAVSSITTAVVPGTGATNLGKAEDAAHTSGDVGVMALAVRSDAGTAFAADGDYVPLSTDSAGALRVTGGGGGTQYTEADTDASITGTAILWEDGSDTLRSVSAAKPLPVGDAGGSLTVDNATLSLTGGGVEAAALRVTIASDSTGVLSVDDNGGSLTIDGTVTANAGTGNFNVIGPEAHDAAVSSNPVVVAARASTAFPTAVSADGDVTRLWSTRTGVLQVTGGNVAEVTGTGAALNATPIADTDCSAFAAISVQLTGTWSADVTFEISNDGSTWVSIPLTYNLTTGTVAPFETTTANGIYFGSLSCTHFRARISSYTSGTVSARAEFFSIARPGNLFGIEGNVNVFGGEVGEGSSLTHSPVFVGVRGSNATPTATGADDTLVGLWANQNGALNTILRTSGNTETGTSGNPLRVDPTGTTAQPVSTITTSIVPGTGATHLGKAEDAAHASGDVGIFALAVRHDTSTTGLGADGDYAALSVDSAGRLYTNAGTAAHDAAITGNPVRVAGRARTSDYTAVANDDTSDLLTDTVGKQVVLLGSIPENFTQGTTGASPITGTTATTIISAPGASVRLYVTSIVVVNGHATVNTRVDLTDGAGGTLLYTGFAQNSGGGWAIAFPTPLRLTANTALSAICATTGASVNVSATAYKAP